MDISSLPLMYLLKQILDTHVSVFISYFCFSIHPFRSVEISHIKRTHFNQACVKQSSHCSETCLCFQTSQVCAVLEVPQHCSCRCCSYEFALSPLLLQLVPQIWRLLPNAVVFSTNCPSTIFGFLTCILRQATHWWLCQTLFDAKNYSISV